MIIFKQMFAFLLLTALFCLGYFCGLPISFAKQSNFTVNKSVSQVTFKKKGKDWRIYSERGEYLGRLKRPKKKNLYLYDKDDNYTGIFFNVIERQFLASEQAGQKDWSLGDELQYVATRTTSTRITAEEGMLYLMVIKAFVKTDKDCDVLEILPIDKRRSKWELFDISNRRVGRLEKVEKFYRLYDENEQYLGSIKEGCFRPKGAKIVDVEPRPTRKTTTITPEVIMFYLQVAQIIS